MASYTTRLHLRINGTLTESATTAEAHFAPSVWRVFMAGLHQRHSRRFAAPRAWAEHLALQQADLANMAYTALCTDAVEQGATDIRDFPPPIHGTMTIEMHAPDGHGISFAFALHSGTASDFDRNRSAFTVSEPRVTLLAFTR